MNHVWRRYHKYHYLQIDAILRQIYPIYTSDMQESKLHAGYHVVIQHFADMINLLVQQNKIKNIK